MEGFVTCQFMAKALVFNEFSKYLYCSDIFSFWLRPTFLAGPYKVYLGDL